ncbi:hypothetical protein SMICM304S_12059 [Streptomyces microflavus]
MRGSSRCPAAPVVGVRVVPACPVPPPHTPVGGGTAVVRRPRRSCWSVISVGWAASRRPATGRGIRITTGRGSVRSRSATSVRGGAYPVRHPGHHPYVQGELDQHRRELRFVQGHRARSVRRSAARRARSVHVAHQLVEAELVGVQHSGAEQAACLSALLGLALALRLGGAGRSQAALGRRFERHLVPGPQDPARPQPRVHRCLQVLARRLARVHRRQLGPGVREQGQGRGRALGGPASPCVGRGQALLAEAVAAACRPYALCSPALVRGPLP